MVHALAGHQILAWIFMLAVVASAVPANVPLTKRYKRYPLNFATVGDSWASGVTYGLFDSTNYDDNSSGCMRLNHAYGVQLRDNLSKEQEVKDGTFNFAACSGSVLENVARGTGQPQLDQTDANLHFVTMQSGGNDAGFYAVASNCIFHDAQGKDYGAEYPAPGACSQAIEDTERFILADSLARGTWKFMDYTIADVLQHPHTQRKDFKLYVLGYAHLFNDGPESAWCDDKSSTVNMKELIRSRTPFGGDPRVKLTQAIRARIDDLTTKMNAQIENVIRYRNDPRVVYISVTEAFNGHRFCEGNSNWYRQYFGTDSWFWNASPDDLFNVGNQAVDGAKYAEALMNQASINNKWNAAYNSTELFESSLQEWDWQDLLATEKGPEAMSPHQGASPGVALRPFHPKQHGHASISEILRARAVEDFTSGCSPACPWN